MVPRATRLRFFSLSLILSAHFAELNLKLIFKQETVDSSPIEFNQYSFHALMAIYGGYQAEYSITDEGLQQVCDLWQKDKFGICQRKGCQGLMNNLFPCSVCPCLRHSPLRYYCFSCEQLYINKTSKSRNIIDGFSYHPLLLSKFMKRFPELMPNQKTEKFVPK